MNEDKRRLLSLVTPIFNEEAVIELFLKTIEKVLSSHDIPFEVICVNDGSQDGTLALLKQHADVDSRIKIVDLSRNYGKEAALTAGIDNASGDAVIPIDCDLQDPPEVIPKMYDQWRKGYQIVLAKRVDREADSRAKRITSNAFYSLLAKISEIDVPENIGDFRLLDRLAVDALKQYPERSRFMKGLFASLGFKQTTVEYVRPGRAAGESKWSYWQLYKLAMEGVVSFTSFPLKIWSYVGVSIGLIAIGYGIYTILRTLVLGVDVPGYASLMVVMLFSSSAILICLGVIGEYLSRVFIEVKQRPLYIIMEKIGFDD